MVACLAEWGELIRPAQQMQVANGGGLHLCYCVYALSNGPV